MLAGPTTTGNGGAGVAPLLSVNAVTLQYKTKQHLVTATYRVGFDVYEADRFVLLGPSGCGKSTLLKSIAGFMPPESMCGNTFSKRERLTLASIARACSVA